MKLGHFSAKNLMSKLTKPPAVFVNKRPNVTTSHRHWFVDRSSRNPVSRLLSVYNYMKILR